MAAIIQFSLPGSDNWPVTTDLRTVHVQVSQPRTWPPEDGPKYLEPFVPWPRVLNIIRNKSESSLKGHSLWRHLCPQASDKGRRWVLESEIQDLAPLSLSPKLHHHLCVWVDRGFLEEKIINGRFCYRLVKGSLVADM